MSVPSFFGFFLRGLPGTASSDVSSDVQLVACMVECTQVFWILFGGLSGRVSSDVSCGGVYG